ncbi:MAG: sulfatase [Gammaproteobacteria bacterium HGW-Gammaproteobacteria-4]|jgi:phosphoglycerol transferase MdoB-like AlkP superfamily enzyme|nr:MAG: sulfatase [Gammaproteobacteria bacterium HGW-Gammaproteobacteria-4]
MTDHVASHHTSNYASPVLALWLSLALFTITRVVLLLWTGIGQVPITLLPCIFGKGLWFDLSALCFLMAPLLLYEALLPERWRAMRGQRVLRLLSFWLLLALLLAVGMAEVTFWDEFSTRFNFIAVDYLVYTHEVIGNIAESYPVAWLLTGVAVIAATAVYALRHAIYASDANAPTRACRLAYAALAFALPVLSLVLADAEQMQGSGNAYADELSGNGLFAFAAAARSNSLDYQRFYATLPQPQADAILSRLGATRGLRASAASLSAPLPETGLGPFKRRPKNVVLISVESLSARFVGSYGSTEGLTPHLDRLAAAGLKFSQVFATGTRTVRGLEALSLGTPPIPGQAIVRRPGNEHLSTIGGLLAAQAYRSTFIYGGYGYFDNMNGYFRGNDYQVIDRTDFAADTIAMENIWGVADESLYANALPLLDRDHAAGKAFFAHLMTTSNHRPFTYPDGRIDIPSPGGREGAVKYTDYAIGQFIEQARGKPWFDDTLFVIVADHCSSVAGRTRLPVEKYHIPLIFYAPALLDPGVDARLMSQIDIAPTLLDALGAQGAGQLFGRSLLREDTNWQGRAFISNYQELGYLKGNVLTVLAPQRKVEAYRIDPKTYDATSTNVDPGLRDETIAWYQTASAAFQSGALRATPIAAKSHTHIRHTAPATTHRHG